MIVVVAVVAAAAAGGATAPATTGVTDSEVVARQTHACDDTMNEAWFAHRHSLSLVQPRRKPELKTTTLWEAVSGCGHTILDKWER